MIYVQKSQPAPESLALEKTKASGKYNLEDVLDRNRADFNNKCYICEYKSPTSINTEHFRPHRNDVDLKFDWNNLFYACVHCNTCKHDNVQFDEILNCTVAEDRVEQSIKHHINPFPKEYAEFTAQVDDPRVHNTVSLLDKVFQGKTINQKMEAANLRSHLLKEVRSFQALLFEYDDDALLEEEKNVIRIKVQRELRPPSNFTAFKRWIIRSNTFLMAEFGQFLEH